MTEANARYLQKDTTAPETTYNFYRDDNGDASRPIHAWFVVQDASGLPGKSWLFWWDASSIPAWMVGLVGNQDSRNLFYAGPGAHYDSFIWSQDAAGNPYISQQDTYLDMGTSNERHSYTTTTLDSHGYGNMVLSQVYDYPLPGSNTPNLLRTTTMTYLHDSNSAYDTAYIRNRVLAKTVTPASGLVITTTNTYDQYPNLYPYNGLTNDAPNLQQHDSTMDTSHRTRGNVTYTAVTVPGNQTPVTTTSTDYDIQGNAIATSDSLGHYNTITVDSYGNVPQSAMPNGNGNLSTSFSFNSFFAPTSVSQPSNGTTASATYDTYGRLSTTTSPGGAVTHYYYCPMVTSDSDSCDKVGFTLPATRNGHNNTEITVINARWSRDQYDGLGRVIRSDRGDTSGNVVSNVDTNYDSCGCSPTGKMVAVSQPYKPGDPVYWTNYTYDGLGRTVQVTAADGASKTTYAYYGSTTVVTDPAGNWKAMTTDIDGNLKNVIEPDPASNPAVPTSAQSIDCSQHPAPSGMLGTCYAYDVLKNLLSVTMPRSNGTQTRTFTYQDGTNWLLTATNPENGKVTYTRDSVGRVTKRVDAGGNTTKYSYDAYGRLTQVTRNDDPCQTENYSYDAQTIDRTFSTGASWGKLTAVTFGNGAGFGGYGVCPGTASDASTWGGITYLYAYSSAGQTTGKRMAVTRTGYQGGPQTRNLDAFWTYDNEGRVYSVQYPVVNDPSTGNPTGTQFLYTPDTMGRPSTMITGPADPDIPNMWVASGVQYNPSDQMTQITYGGYNNQYTYGNFNETRTYNSMNQVTKISANWYCYGCGGSSFSEQYNYPAGTNNGQISSVTEGTGETMSYQYDKLKRLISATSSAWGQQSYTYDGFGNMTGKTGSFSMLADPATNRLTNLPSGWSYDANGNLYQGHWSYDAENRLVGVDAGGGERYLYDPSNKRIYKQNNGEETYFFYGVDGRVMGEYSVSWNGPNGPYSFMLNRITESAYFGGKKVLPAVARDRLGSVRGNASPANRPYGENYTGENSDGFATYYQDYLSGLNYADQRYYAATYGRFQTPDPSGDAWDPANPQSWNSYTYVLGDPINLNDPDGLVECGDLNVVGGGSLRDYVNARSDAGKLTRFVWAEGGTLDASGGSQQALGVSMAYIAQAIENRLDVANGRVAVAGVDGNIYWGNGGTFNGVTTLAASILGYGGLGTTLSQELVRAAAGTGEVNRNGELVNQSGLQGSLNTELGDPTRALAGRVPVTLVNGTVDYVTPECDRAILAMQATNTILSGVSLNGPGDFVTSWKQAGHGNTNPNPSRLGSLGTIGGTQFFGIGGYEYDQYPYPRVPRPRPRR